jgi:hypothetical protein
MSRPAPDDRPATALHADGELPASLPGEELNLKFRVAERSIRFGTVQLVVPDGKVVRIGSAEKFRLR